MDKVDMECIFNRLLYRFLCVVVLLGLVVWIEPAEAARSLPEVIGEDEATNNGIWNAWNCFIVNTFAWFIYYWPSTPEFLKMSSLVQELKDYAPFVPWYIFIRLFNYTLFLYSFGAMYKLAKAWRP